MTNPTRRAMLATLAAPVAFALPAAAASAPASPADPVFAAIEAHRAADARYKAASATREAIEAEHAATKPEAWDFEAYRRWVEDTPGLSDAMDDTSETGAREEASLTALVMTTPATPTGLRALILYVCDLTRATEGHAVEGQSPAYRVLANMAGLPVRGEDIPEGRETDWGPMG